MSRFRRLTLLPARPSAHGQRLTVAGLAALLIAVVVVASLLLGGSTSARAAVGPCTDVQFIGLRGSGESSDPRYHGMGSLLGPQASHASEQFPSGTTVSFYGLPYPAGDAGISTVLNGDYFDSKKRGSAMLADYLAEVIAACPATKLVVMGYSQGAHAAGDLLAGAPQSVTDHIGAFVMFGDPRFNPDATYNFGSYDLRNYGIAGKRSLGDFTGWTRRVLSVCNQNDIVCQGIGFEHGAGPHAQARYLNAYGDIVASFVRNRLGFPRTSTTKTPIDLAFVIDSTGSMSSSIAGVKAAATTMTQALDRQGADFRVGLVDYKDTDQGDPYAARVDLDFTNDVSAFSSALDTVSADGGGDGPEAVYSGLMTAINDLTWRPTPRRTIILMGDAPAKNPEPITGYTQASVLAAARAIPATASSLMGVASAKDLRSATSYTPTAAPAAPAGSSAAAIYPVAVGTYGTSTFQPLADGSGGKLFQADDPSEVADQIVAAVDTAAVPLYTGLTVHSPARPGDSVAFSAAASYYDGGVIQSYGWDFDGDGTIDQTTSGPHTSRVYDTPFAGTATVTVTTDDGHTGTATAAVDIRNDAPVLPSAPTNLSASGHGEARVLNVSWSAPADLGGGSLAGYQVEVVEQSTGLTVAAAATDTLAVSITGIAVGNYSVRVSAANSAGLGSAAEQVVTLAVTPPAAVPGPPPVAGRLGATARSRCVVPSLKGLTLTKAKKRLQAAHCKLGRTTVAKAARNRKRSKLVVVSQSHKAKRKLAAGSKVTVTLGVKAKKAATKQKATKRTKTVRGR